MERWPSAIINMAARYAVVAFGAAGLLLALGFSVYGVDDTDDAVEPPAGFVELARWRDGLCWPFGSCMNHVIYGSNERSARAGVLELESRYRLAGWEVASSSYSRSISVTDGGGCRRDFTDFTDVRDDVVLDNGSDDVAAKAHQYRWVIHATIDGC